MPEAASADAAARGRRVLEALPGALYRVELQIRQRGRRSRPTWAGDAALLRLRPGDDGRWWS